MLCVGTGAFAQQLYKQVDATGQVTFADRPDAALAELAVLAPLAAPAPEPARVPKRIAGISSPRAAAAVDASEAARRLRQAQLKRQEGMEPMPGERTAGVPNARYWRRQEKLRHLVDTAQRRQQETAQLKLSAR